MAYIALKIGEWIIISKNPIGRCSLCKMISHKFKVPLDSEYENPFHLPFKRIQCAICGKVSHEEISLRNEKKERITREIYEAVKERFEDFEKLGLSGFLDKYGDRIFDATYGLSEKGSGIVEESLK